jgi:hypothetical protein
LDLAVGTGGAPLIDPLTVCLSVLGTYVPSLAFLGVVLGDEAVEGLNTYYQRLVARDQDEAAAIVEAALQTQPLVDVYDTVLVSALSYTKQDLERAILTTEEAQSIVQATQEIVEDLTPYLHPVGPEASPAGENGAPLSHESPSSLSSGVRPMTTSTRWRCACSSRSAIPRAMRSNCSRPGYSRPRWWPGWPRLLLPSSVLGP